MCCVLSSLSSIGGKYTLHFYYHNHKLTQWVSNVNKMFPPCWYLFVSSWNGYILWYLSFTFHGIGTGLIGKNQGHFHHLHFSFMQEILTIILWEICRWQDLQIIGKFYAHWAHTFAIPIPIAFLSTFCSFHFFIFVEIVDTSWGVGSVGILYLDLDTVQNVKKS